jgi:hypothetical protein
MKKKRFTGLSVIYNDVNINSENNIKNITKRFSKQKVDFVL